MEQRQIYLRDILTVLFKRKVQIIGFAVIVILGVFVGNIIWPRTYESQAKIQLVRGAETSQVQPIVTTESGTTVVTMNEFDMNSEIQILYSNDVLGAVVDEISKDPELGFQVLTQSGPGPIRKLMSSVQQSIAGAVTSEEDQRLGGIAILRSAIVVRPIKDSFTLEVLCRLGTADSAQKVLETTLSVYRKQRLDLVYNPGGAYDYFVGRRDEAMTAWLDAQENMRRFREGDVPTIETVKREVPVDKDDPNSEKTEVEAKKVVFSADSASKDTTASKTEVFEVEIQNELLTEQYSELMKAKLQLKDLAKELGAASETETPAPVPAAQSGAEDSEAQIAEQDKLLTQILSRETTSTVLTERRLQLLRLINQRNETRQAKGIRHPEYQGLNRQIADAQKNLQEALRSEEERIDGQIEDVSNRRTALAKLIDIHDVLSKEVELKAEEYEFYSTKVKEASVVGGLTANSTDNVRIVQKANQPTSPIRPRKTFNMIIGIMAGVVGGIALAFFLEYLDHGIKTPEDVEHFFNVAPLASFFGSSGTKLDDREAQRLNSILEALYSDQPLQFIGVASSIGGENSHQVARTLADAAAGDPDGHVLLIDFDGAAIPEAASGRGLLDVVLGEAQAQDVVTTIGDLYVMSRGTQKDCPVYLWNSERMREVIADLRGRFKRIIFHVPPVLSSHDAVNLVRHADGMIVVVKTDSTRREVVMRSMETLAEAKGRVLGAVLTDRKQLIPKAVYKRI